MHRVSYLEILSEFLWSDRVDEKILKYPRLKTFESFGRSNEKTTEENRLQLFGDFIEAKNNLNIERNMNKDTEFFLISGRPLSIR